MAQSGFRDAVPRRETMSDSNDSYPNPGKTRHHFVGAAGIGDEHIHVLDGADQRWRDDAQFAGISHDNDLLGLLDHRANGEVRV
jgi:hypothetical protein